MYLKRLEIHGFKSFAKPTKLVFENGITSIVGPNGSGKSNIADAVRWVLGEQSKSVIRSKKSDDVIFVGSASKSKAPSASVSVVFDNRDGKLPIDASEVEFSRRVYRDGNSEYFINNTTARLMDITEALASSGFMQSRYSVIGQGVIDQFLLQGSAHIKTLIEEAAGLSNLYEKRDNALKRMLRTKDNLERVEALLVEIEPRLKTLRRQAKKLQERDNIETEWKKRVAGRFKFILSELIAEKQKIKFDIEALSKEILIFEKKIESILSERKVENTNTSDQTRELTGLQQQIMVETRNKEQIEKNLSEVKIKLLNFSESKNTNNVALEVEKTKDLYTKARELTDDAVENYEQSKEDIDEIISILNSSKPELVVRFKKISDKFIETQYQFLLKLKEQQNELQRKLQTLEIQNSTQIQNKDDKNYSNLEKSLSEELAKKNAEISDLHKRFQNELANLSQFNSGREEQDENLRKLEKNNSSLNSQLNEYQIKLTRVETKLEDVEIKAKDELGSNYLEIIGNSEVISNPEEDLVIAHLKKQLESIGGLDEMTLQEYKESEDRFTYLSSQVEDLQSASSDLDSVVTELDKVIKKNFLQAYEIINEKFDNYFRLLFNGGKADLVIVKEEKNKEENLENEELEVPSDIPKIFEILGVEVKATPPGKKLTSIASLSGGERTLTSIALLMSLLDAYPSPFVILDEADAALDESNSIRFAKILGELSEKTQFITITHNRETMRRSHTLYGVSMGEDGISQLLSIKLDESLQYTKD